MKRQENPRISLVLVALVVVCVISAEEAMADYVFGKAVNLGPVVNSQYNDGYGGASISADGLSFYFDSERPGGFGSRDIWVTTRATVSDPWGPAVNLGATVNSASHEESPFISFDGLSLYFSSFRPPCLGGQFGGDLWVTTRATPSDPWGPPVHLDPPVNSSYDEYCPYVSRDGLLLLFSGNRADTYGRWDLYQCTRPTPQSPWAPPVNLGPRINTAISDFSPSMSADGRVLFFARQRAPAFVVSDMWMTTRTSTNDDWSAPVQLGPNINTPSDQYPTGLAADGSILYFGSNRWGGVGGYDLWQLPIIPVIDFDGDEIVDISDLATLIEHWGEDYSLCDIGPTPFGDGIVDVQDLAVLIKHIEPIDRTLIAHWTLDEAQGKLARDGAGGDHNGTVMGNPVWQPAGGKVKGALLLDGADDCISTEYVLTPFAGPFSVFAWVTGGAPGQVILSQEKAADWLMVGPNGELKTSLKSPGRLGKALTASVLIADGAWHRVGLVWDGSNRVLYVDDVEVARDTQTSLTSAASGLYIGAGSTLAPGTFWSGLIDDVRIYIRAIIP